MNKNEEDKMKERKWAKIYSDFDDDYLFYYIRIIPENVDLLNFGLPNGIGTANKFQTVEAAEIYADKVESLMQAAFDANETSLLKIMEESIEEDTWVPPETVKPVIVCAANRYGKIVVLGVRHFHPTMLNQMQLFRPEVLKAMKDDKCEQGFVDQFGRFYSRKQAMDLVKSTGQKIDLNRNGGDGSELYSEGLY